MGICCSLCGEMNLSLVEWVLLLVGGDIGFLVEVVLILKVLVKFSDV